jgi:MFS family permease
MPRLTPLLTNLSRRARGWTNLAINGTWWVGTAFGAIATALLLTPLPPNIGWRLAFGLGAILGLAILLVRRHVPERPRWLMMHGRFDEANQVVDMIENEVKKDDHISVLPIFFQVSCLRLRDGCSCREFSMR